jgi:hypothetical protein
MAQGRPGQKERGQKQKRFPGTAELAVRQASKGVAPECETDDQEKASGLSFLKGPSRQKRPQQKWGNGCLLGGALDLARLHFALPSRRRE